MSSIPLKFPRTPHLLSLGDGTVTRDDLLLSSPERSDFLRFPLTIEEKLDGANLGVSRSDDGYSLRFQNRSKYVTSASGSQWSALREFEVEFGGVLMDLMDEAERAMDLADERKTHNGGRGPAIVSPRGKAVIEDGKSSPTIVFGEWLWARHSVHYGSLPNYFLIFDIHARGRFVSTSLRDSLVELVCAKDEWVSQRPLVTVPVLGRGVRVTDENALVLAYLEGRTSAFGVGSIEGVVLRIEDDDVGLIRRAKVVNAGFTQMLEEGHWSKRIVERNQLRF
ncbi:hypothetical protein HK101_009856 [Irineochytrium annulatum]|nr:hypothetical protein HK101_009856 [Irineochytrium annulatum]